MRLLRYVRVPKVHQKDQPGPVPVVHHLVLEAVVDDRPLARLPSHSLVAHPDTHLPLLGHDQTKVSTEPRVGGSRVRGDRCVGGDQGEACLALGAARGLRELLEKPDIKKDGQFGNGLGA